MACLGDPLELSEEVGKWAKQMVGFSREGQQDLSPEAFFGKWTNRKVGFSKEGQQDPWPEAIIECELLLIRKSL